MQKILRIDKWLWCARFFKSRTLASRFCVSSGLRVNGWPVRKPHHKINVGDIITFLKGKEIRIIKVNELGIRRGPATEARTLYEDLAKQMPNSMDEFKSRPKISNAQIAKRNPGSGRPTKAERRATEKLRGKFEE